MRQLERKDGVNLNHLNDSNDGGDHCWAVNADLEEGIGITIPDSTPTFLPPVGSPGTTTCPTIATTTTTTTTTTNPDDVAPRNAAGNIHSEYDVDVTEKKEGYGPKSVDVVIQQRGDRGGKVNVKLLRQPDHDHDHHRPCATRRRPSSLREEPKELLRIQNTLCDLREQSKEIQNNPNVGVSDASPPTIPLEGLDSPAPYYNGSDWSTTNGAKTRAAGHSLTTDGDAKQHPQGEKVYKTKDDTMVQRQPHHNINNSVDQRDNNMGRLLQKQAKELNTCTTTSASRNGITRNSNHGAGSNSDNIIPGAYAIGGIVGDDSSFLQQVGSTTTNNNNSGAIGTDSRSNNTPAAASAATGGDHHHHDRVTMGIPVSSSNITSTTTSDQHQHQLVANQVDPHENDNLPRAQAVVQPQHDDDNNKDMTGGAIRSGCSLGFCKLALLVGALILATGIIIAVVVALPASSSNTNSQEEASTLPPTPTPTSSGGSVGDSSSSSVFVVEKQRIRYLLPNETIATIQEDPNSPQSRAYQWLLKDPALENYTDNRLVQRYSLATIFYSMNGTNWYNHTNWLSYHHHECSWFTKHMEQTNPVAMNDPLFEFFLANSNESSSPCGASSNSSSSNPPQDRNNTDDDGDMLYKHLWLYNQNLTGTLPPELYLLTSLQSILLWKDPNLGGIIDTRIGTLTSLQVLSFIDSALTGSITTHLGLLTNLQILTLSGTKLHGTIPSQLGNLKPLQSLTLDRIGQLTGTLPPELVGLSQLHSMSVATNQLTGSIPHGIGSMEAMSALNLGLNLFTGPLPSSMGMLTELQGMFHYYNQHSGTIPADLGLLTLLEHFAVSDNHLTGTIPSTLGLLSNLLLINAPRNQLSGSIPKELDALAVNGSLIAIQLEGNDLLSGTIPSQLCDVGVNKSCPYFHVTCSMQFDCSDILCGCDCPC